MSSKFDFNFSLAVEQLTEAPSTLAKRLWLERGWLHYGRATSLPNCYMSPTAWFNSLRIVKRMSSSSELNFLRRIDPLLLVHQQEFVPLWLHTLSISCVHVLQHKVRQR